LWGFMLAPEVANCRTVITTAVLVRSPEHPTRSGVARHWVSDDPATGTPARAVRSRPQGPREGTCRRRHRRRSRAELVGLSGSGSRVGGRPRRLWTSRRPPSPNGASAGDWVGSPRQRHCGASSDDPVPFALSDPLRLPAAPRRGAVPRRERCPRAPDVAAGLVPGTPVTGGPSMVVGHRR